VESVVAYDLTEEILEAAKSFVESNGNVNVHFVQGDAENLPFDDSEFDVITCRIAAHHFPNLLSFIKESYRVLKKNGKFLLIDNIAPEKEEFDKFYNKVEQDRDYSHHRAWKKSEWLRMLEETGYEIDETYRFLKTFTFEDWANRMNLSNDKKRELSDYMCEKPEEYHNKFRIKVVNGQVHSFVGESILLKAVKHFEQ
ncbi:SAM-dependent methyltransferase, partial [Bacillus sp. LL01]|uniref:class I SAM-dependent methyltransferase n=1 Tax=Bacillus sp. LL01 TaxID=1665556 RepID=UPI00064D05F6